MSSGQIVVVDANILIAALLRPDGWTAQELKRTDLQFMAPDICDHEMASHVSLLARRTATTPAILDDRWAAVSRRVVRVARTAWAPHLEHQAARRAWAVDPADAPYMATASCMGAALVWTRDKALQAAFPGIAVSVLPE